MYNSIIIYYIVAATIEQVWIRTYLRVNCNNEASLGKLSDRNKWNNNCY